ncbi:MAG TPA: VOC family protein [Acidimicrobiales bacterium]|nr:VOC family protein [Acidimicrobiales bacterium]
MTIGWLTVFFDFPEATFTTGTSFWQAITQTTLSPLRGVSSEFSTLNPDRGDAYLRVQRIDQGVAGIHLDLHSDNVDATASEAQSLGATLRSQRPGLVILNSPGGLTFCVVEHREERHRPAPSRWPAGYRSLVDQMCIDVPPNAFAEECMFWSRVTTWERHVGSRPEFEYLTRPATIPLRLLLQRLDDESAEDCRAHLDLACDDVASEQRRHEELGAVIERVTTNWTTLRDPAGLSYCITRRSPDTGTLQP